MKLCRIFLVVVIFFGCLSSCAYIQGRKMDQQANAVQSKKTTNGAGQNQPAENNSTPDKNPAASASRMLAPLT